MGYALSWIAFNGVPPDEVNRRFNLSPTGKREEFPESEIVSTILPNGMYLVVFDQYFVEEKELKRVSDNCELIYCAVEEHVMYSQVSQWKNGKEKWYVEHDAQRGIDHIISNGKLPPSSSTIYKEYKNLQKKSGGERSKVDYIFEIPVKLAKEITGYQHDIDILNVDKDPFEVLEKSN